MFKVFYSWQSDLPPNTNRNFILAAMERACEIVKSDGSVKVEPVIDRDTLNTPGAPNISDVIFDKIADADAFIADVSFVNQPAAGAFGALEGTIRSLRGGRRARATPNPNVLTELGFAVANLGHEALALAFNTCYGRPDDLPFDVRNLRLLTYTASPSETSRAHARKDLTKKLVDAIKAIAEVRRNDPIYDVIYPKTRSVWGQAIGMFAELFKAAGFSFDLETATRENVLAVCKKVSPFGIAPLRIDDVPGITRDATWVEWMKYWRKRSGQFTNEVMFFDAFLSREHVALLGMVEHSHHFALMDALGTRAFHVSLEPFEPSLWSYLLAARRLEHYTERVLARRVGGI